MNYGIYLNIFPKIATSLAGLDTANISYIGGVASMIAGFTCIFIIGLFGEQFGKKKIILILLFIQIVTTILGLFFQTQWHQLSFLYAISISTAVTRYGLLTLIAAIAMSLCNSRVSATQFTLYLAFTNLGMAIAATMVGSLDKLGGFFALFTAYGVIAFIALITAFFLKDHAN